MKRVVMAAAAVFFVAISVPALAQETMTTTAESTTMSTAGFCPFGDISSNFECADAAQKAFSGFSQKAREAPVSDFPELAKELREMRAKYLVWFNQMKTADGLKPKTSLRILLEQSVQPAILAGIKAIDAKYKSYNDEVSYTF